ncbi:MAG: hypothetical protein ABSA59_02620 [Terriglobia bacterium]
MKRNLIYIGICITVIFAASLAIAKDKKGPMTGTWDCQAHGGSQGDMAFTLILQQNKETVDGSISSPIGGTQISSGTFKKNMLEIHLDTPQGNYVLMAKFSKGTLSGKWSSDNDKGTWEGKKQAPASK